MPSSGEGLTLSAPIAVQLLEHARAELPNEACGLLSGSRSDGLAARFHPARNADASPTIYTVHPDDLLRIMLAIDDADEDLVAIFHSHTHTPAVPSATDRRQAFYPDAIYLLASLSEADAPPERALRAWRILDGESSEVPLTITR